MDLHLERPGRVKRAPGFAELAGASPAIAAEGVTPRHVVWCLVRGGLLAGLTRTERDVLVSLALWITPHRLRDHELVVGVTNERIAADVGVGPRSVQTALGALEAAGWLVRRYTETNRRYGAGGIDLARLVARLPELEAAVDQAEAARRERQAEEAATRLPCPARAAPAPVWQDSGSAGAGEGRSMRSEISSPDAMDCVVTQIQPPDRDLTVCSGSARGRSARGEGEAGRPALARVAAPSAPGRGGRADGSRSRSGPSGPAPAPQAAARPYFPPGKLAPAPASTPGVVGALAALDPDLAAMMEGQDPRDWECLVRCVRYLARDLGLPEPVLDRAIEAKGALFVAPAVIAARTKARRGELNNPVGWCRALLEGDRPIDVWRTVYALRRAVN